MAGSGQVFAGLRETLPRFTFRAVGLPFVGACERGFIVRAVARGEGSLPGATSIPTLAPAESSNGEDARRAAQRLAHRLRRLAIDRADAPPEQRQAVLRREVEGTVDEMSGETRLFFLAELRAHFPCHEDDVPPAWWGRWERWEPDARVLTEEAPAADPEAMESLTIAPEAVPAAKTSRPASIAAPEAEDEAEEDDEIPVTEVTPAKPQPAAPPTPAPEASEAPAESDEASLVELEELDSLPGPDEAAPPALPPAPSPPAPPKQSPPPAEVEELAEAGFTLIDVPSTPATPTASGESPADVAAPHEPRQPLMDSQAELEEEGAFEEAGFTLHPEAPGAGGRAKPSAEQRLEPMPEPKRVDRRRELADTWAKLGRLRGQVEADLWEASLANARNAGVLPDDEPNTTPAAPTGGGGGSGGSGGGSEELTARYWELEPKLRRKWQLGGNDVIDPSRLLELADVLVPHVVAVDNYGRKVLDQIAPVQGATILEAGTIGPAPLTERRLFGWLLSRTRGDAQRLRNDAGYGRRLVTGLVGAMNGLGGRLRDRLLGRISPEGIRLASGEASGRWLGGGEKAAKAEWWDRYEQLYHGLGDDALEAEVAHLVHEYVEPFLVEQKTAHSPN